MCFYSTPSLIAGRNEAELHPRPLLRPIRGGHRGPVGAALGNKGRGRSGRARNIEFRLNKLLERLKIHLFLPISGVFFVVSACDRSLAKCSSRWEPRVTFL